MALSIDEFVAKYATSGNIRQQNARPAQQQSTQPVQRQIGRTPSIDEFVAIYATKRPSGPDTSSPTDYAAAYKRRNALSANIRRLESERTTRSQIWENGIYMGEDSAAAADYDRQIAALRKQMDALPKISAWERTKNAVAGGSGQWASGQVSAAGTVAGNISRTRTYRGFTPGTMTCRRISWTDCRPLSTQHRLLWITTAVSSS